MSAKKQSNKDILVVAVNGSPRKNGNTVMLLKRALKGVKKEGGKTKFIHLIDKKIKSCLGCYSINPKKCTYPCRQNDDMKKICKLLVGADGIVLGSPSYWFNMSGLMKNFIDRLNCLENNGFLLKGKVGGAVASAEETGGEEVTINLISVLNEMGLTIPPFSIIFYCSKYKNKWAIEDAEKLGRNIVVLARTQRDKKIKWKY